MVLENHERVGVKKPCARAGGMVLKNQPMLWYNKTAGKDVGDGSQEP